MIFPDTELDKKLVISVDQTAIKFFVNRGYLIYTPYFKTFPESFFW